MHDELSGEGFTIIGVAIDGDIDAIRTGATAISFPILMDPDHLVTELYAISNVPTVVWIDEDDRIVQPNWVAFGTDTFLEFTGIESEPQKDLIRSWVRDGTAMMSPEQARAAVEDLTTDEQQARLYFRIGAHLKRSGDEPGAQRNLKKAVELAPHDWTVRRAAMPLQGKDPFGEEFFTMYQEWQEAGSPYHGVASR
ncbi:MAG: thioredoxin family protein [Acidimicrobiales bacterium]